MHTIRKTFPNTGDEYEGYHSTSAFAQSSSSCNCTPYAAQTPCHALCSACASSAGPLRPAPAGETSCSSRSPPTSVVQTSLQLQGNLCLNVKQIDHSLQTDKLQGQFLLKSRAVATDWESADSAECDYYCKLYSLPGNINLLSRPSEMRLASPQLDNERNAIHA